MKIKYKNIFESNIVESSFVLSFSIYVLNKKKREVGKIKSEEVVLF